MGGDWTYDEERVAAGDGRDGERAARLLSGEDAQSSAAASESHGGELRCHCVEGVRWWYLNWVKMRSPNQVVKSPTSTSIRRPIEWSASPSQSDALKTPRFT